MLCKLRRRLLVLRCSTGNHLAEVLGLLPEHHGSGNRSFTCIRFTNAGNIQRVSGQYCIHLVWLVTEHREDQVFCHGIRTQADTTVAGRSQQRSTQQLRNPISPKMLVFPFNKAREDVIHLAGIGSKKTNRRDNSSQMIPTDTLQLRELLPAFELNVQDTIVQEIPILRVHSLLSRRLNQTVFHATIANNRKPCSQHNMERRIPHVLGNQHFWRVHSINGLTEPPHCLTVEQYRIGAGLHFLHQPLSQLNSIRLQLLTKILPPGVDASGGQNDPGGRTPPAQGAQQSRELLLSGFLRVVDHDEKLGGEFRKVCQIVIPHRALSGSKTCAPAEYLQIVTQLRRHTGLTRPSRTGQHGNRDIRLPSGTPRSSHRPFLELPILRTRTEGHHTVTGLDHLQRRTVIRQRQVTRRQHLLSAHQGGEL